MKNILIIGGGGYIGSVLSNFLSQNTDFDITSIDINHTYKYNRINYINDKYDNLNVEFYNKFTDIILLAGHSCISNSKDLLNVIDNNVRNFAWLLEIINDNQKLIYASSSSIYGFNNKETSEEFTNYNPITYYDLCKYIIDNIAKLSNKHYYGLRFGSVNGFSDNLRTDIMINSMIYNGKLNNKFVIKNKNTYRPILGINDLCKVFLTIINNENKELSGIYNINSFNSSVIEIADKIKEITNINYELIEDDNIFYDFKISSKKFISNFNFTFKDTLETIIIELNNKII